MKYRVFAPDDTEQVVPLTLKVPLSLYKRICDVVASKKGEQQKDRKKAKRERQKSEEIGVPARETKLLTKQSLLLSIVYEVLKDKQFKIDVD